MVLPAAHRGRDDHPCVVLGLRPFDVRLDDYWPLRTPCWQVDRIPGILKHLRLRPHEGEHRLAATAGDEQLLAARLDEALAELERLSGPLLPDGRHFGYLAAVGAAQQPPRLVIDVAQWFTDQEAIDAAIDDGVAPWENGYYIRNEHPRWRIVEVDPASTVSLVVYPYGDIEQPRTVSLARFGELFGADEHGAFQGLPYWITVRDDTVIAIEQQFIP